MKSHLLIHNTKYNQDPLYELTKLIVKHNKNQLCDLTDVVILLPHASAISRMKKLLIKEIQTQGQNALLGPQILTLPSWIGKTQVTFRTLNQYERELLFLNELRQYHHLFGKANLWTVTQSLLELFDEFTLNNISLPSNFDAFIKSIEKGYKIQKDKSATLSREANMIHILWHAWHNQLDALQLSDSIKTYAIKLGLNPGSRQHNIKYYLAGIENFSNTELNWIKATAALSNTTIVTQLPIHENSRTAEFFTKLLRDNPFFPSHSSEKNNSYSAALNTIFNFSEIPLLERAQNFATNYAQSPIATRVSILAANSFEEEAVAIDLTIRNWYLEGHRNIAFITENRKLARRVRALLERANLITQDSTGWALSTTSAASALERWLQTVEQDFAYLPFLDFLKSPFVFPDIPRDKLLECVYRLEKDLVGFENILANLDRYRTHIKYRQQRIENANDETMIQLDVLLKKLQLIAHPLMDLTNNSTVPANEHIHILIKSIQDIGLSESFSQDDAGVRILDILYNMRQATEDSSIVLTWKEFRTWLGNSLEQNNFKPQIEPSPVHISNLANSNLMTYDKIIIGSMERQYLPSTQNFSPFFNESVRLELGLTTLQDKIQIQFQEFRRILEAGSSIVLTYTKEENGEEIIPCPWLEQIRAFHNIAYHSSLQENTISAILEFKNYYLSKKDIKVLPSIINRPAPSPLTTLIPKKISASSYQTLLDCPYKFYVSKCLRLQATEDIKTALQKSDFGHRIHLCLEAFHNDVPGLYGPFKGDITTNTRSEAIALLNKLSNQVFAKDLEDNFLHRGWLERWISRIPDYIDWQIVQGHSWIIADLEQKFETEINKHLKIIGRIDRIDKNSKHKFIIDYKTGAVPNTKMIEFGEAIQLPFYAMLFQSAVANLKAGYLMIGKDKIEMKNVMEGENFMLLTQKIETRLIDIIQDLKYNALNLPAFGEEVDCLKCDYMGLCRKSMWHEDSDNYGGGPKAALPTSDVV